MSDLFMNGCLIGVDKGSLSGSRNNSNQHFTRQGSNSKNGSNGNARPKQKGSYDGSSSRKASTSIQRQTHETVKDYRKASQKKNHQGESSSWGSTGTRYGRNGFVQANCSFLSTSLNGQQFNTAIGSDLTIPWDAVDVVKVTAVSDTQCPICLSTPTAPRITECGHVYCFPCLLHYLTTFPEQPEYKKTNLFCPMCYSYLHPESCKVAMVSYKQPFVLNDVIELSLRRVCKGSGLVEVMNSDNKWVPEYSRVENISEEDLCAILLEEMLALQAMTDLVLEDTEPQFIAEAITMNDRKIEVMRARSLANKEAKQPTPKSVDDESNGEFFYYYQSTDGQRIFLSTFNIRCLLHQFEKLEPGVCPSRISGKIQDLVLGCVSESFKKRFKFFVHLPLHSAFCFAELDLSNVLSDDTVSHFKAEISGKRRQRNQRKNAEAAYHKNVNESMSLLEMRDRLRAGVSYPAEPSVFDFETLLAECPSLPGAEQTVTTSETDSQHAINASSFAHILSSDPRPVAASSSQGFVPDSESDFPTLGSTAHSPPPETCNKFTPLANNMNLPSSGLATSPWGRPIIPVAIAASSSTHIEPTPVASPKDCYIEAALANAKSSKRRRKKP